MCSFLFTNKCISNVDKVNVLLKKRGPDVTNYTIHRNFFYLHNLLSITGTVTKQPLNNEETTLIYNGEIYNYQNFGSYESDGQCILDLYKSYGKQGFKLLDGEFAILIHDHTQKKIYLCTDTFCTKPIFYSIEGDEIGVCSYSSPLKSLGFNEIVRCKPNQITVIDEISKKVIEEIPLFDFSLIQNKNSYDDWQIAFEKSIEKRVKDIRHNVVVPMSSGHDSGLICCILDEKNFNYATISIRGKENQEILNKRFQLKNGNKLIYDSISNQEIEFIKNEFTKNVENFFYGPDPEKPIQDGFSDQGAIGLYFVLKRAKESFDSKIILSGQGSDEMMTNIKEYGFQTRNPIPFPDNLEKVFPWGNFYYGSQSSYLMKEECVAGSLGMETRYPFLDRDLIQEFLWLSSKLKNDSYKAPIAYVFKQKQYPYFEGKMGFNIGC
jgi:asparagine synthetase B (glutamine-hydrolysing)